MDMLLAGQKVRGWNSSLRRLLGWPIIMNTSLCDQMKKIIALKSLCRTFRVGAYRVEFESNYLCVLLKIIS